MLLRGKSLFRGAIRASRAAMIVTGALLAASSFGCASIAGEQAAETKFLVKPKSDASFFGWSEITISEDVNSVSGATLRAVTVEATEPASVTTMGFIQSVVGEAVTSTARTTLVEKAPMPSDERLVPLDLKYKDDLRGFFEDGHTIRIEWTGKTSASFPWPAEGIWVKVRVVVEIE